MRDYTQVALLVLFVILVGHHTYVAWFKPDQHKSDLAAMGRWYRSWSPQTERWVVSAFGYWLTRFAYLFAFAIAVLALSQEIIRRFF